MNAYRSSTIADAFRQPRYEKKKYGNENRINLKENTANVYKVTGIALV